MPGRGGRRPQRATPAPRLRSLLRAGGAAREGLAGLAAPAGAARPGGDPRRGGRAGGAGAVPRLGAAAIGPSAGRGQRCPPADPRSRRRLPPGRGRRLALAGADRARGDGRSPSGHVQQRSDRIGAFPPSTPGSCGRRGYAPFIETLRANLRERRRPAHRPRDGPRAPLVDPGRERAGRRRLRQVPGRRPARDRRPGVGPAPGDHHRGGPRDGSRRPSLPAAAAGVAQLRGAPLRGPPTGALAPARRWPR